MALDAYEWWFVILVGIVLTILAVHYGSTWLLCPPNAIPFVRIVDRARFDRPAWNEIDLVILSFTTSPQRQPKIDPFLQALQRQTARRHVEVRVVAALPRTFRGKPAQYLPANQLSPLWRDVVRLERVEDVGPATKVVHAGCLARQLSLQGRRVVIISVDDDINYPPEWLHCLLAAYLSIRTRPVAVCMHAASLMPSRFGPTHLAPLTNKPLFAPDQRIQFVEGFAGVLYPPEVFTRDLVEYLDQQQSRAIRLSDDLILSLWLKAHQVAVCNLGAALDFRPDTWALPYGEDDDALHVGTDGYGACMEEWFRFHSGSAMVSYCSPNTKRYVECIEELCRDGPGEVRAKLARSAREFVAGEGLIQV